MPCMPREAPGSYRQSPHRESHKRGFRSLRQGTRRRPSDSRLITPTAPPTSPPGAHHYIFRHKTLVFSEIIINFAILEAIYSNIL
nr:MAG TPA: hypothetical protein [Caudoviricetes sp.]